MIAFIIIVTGIIALTLAFTAGRKKNITVYNRDYNGHKSASDELPERYRMSKGLFIALLLQNSVPSTTLSSLVPRHTPVWPLVSIE